MKNRLISFVSALCILASCIVCQPVSFAESNKTSAAGGTTEDVTVAKVVFGDNAEQFGFSSVATGDGVMNYVTKNGVKGLTLNNVDKNQNSYLYFNFSDSFAKEVSDGSVFDFEIEYYSESNAYVEFIYDSVITESTRGKWIDMGNDLAWKTYTVTIDDAFFGERLAKNSDFYITSLCAARDIQNNNYSPSSVKPIIKSVTVTKHTAAKPITVVSETYESGNTFEWYKESKPIANKITNTFDEAVDVNITYKATDHNQNTRWQKMESLKIAAKETIENEVNIETDYCSLYDYIVEIEIPAKSVSYSYDMFDFAIVKTDPNGIKDDKVFYQVSYSRYPEKESSDMIDMIRKSNAAGVREGLYRYSFGTGHTVVMRDKYKKLFEELRENDLKVALVLMYWSPYTDGIALKETLSYTDGYPAGIKEDLYNFLKVATDETKDLAVMYEVWNEPNLEGFGFTSGEQTSKGYMTLVKDTSKHLRELAPDAEIITGAYAYTYEKSITSKNAEVGQDFHKRMVDMGVTDYCDGFSIHTYNVRQYEDENVFDIFNWYKEYAEEVSGKDDVSIWVTECGNPIGTYCETDEMQAYKNMRVLLADRSMRLKIDGASAVYRFEKMGPRLNDREDMFGVVGQGEPRNLEDNARRFVPHEAFVASTALSYILANSEAVNHTKTDENMWIEEYDSSKFGKDIAAIWYEKDEKVKTFDLGCNEISVFDMYGNETKLKSGNGKYTFVVSETPFYVMGDFDKVTVCDESVLTYNNIEISAAQGDVVRIEAYKEGALDGSVIEMDMPDFAELIKTEEFKDGKGAVEYRLRPGYDGTMYINGCLKENGAASEYMRFRFIVSDQIAAEVSNAFPGGSDYNIWQLVFNITNNSLSEVATGKIRINSPSELKGEYDIDIGNVLKGKTSKIVANIPEVRRKQMYYLNYDVLLDNGTSYNYNQQLDFTIAPKRKTDIVIDGKIDKGEWNKSTSMISDSEENLKLITNWGGTNDLSGYAMIQWDEEKLYMFASVSDDVHSNPNTADRLWAGDSIQFAVYKPEFKTVAMGQDTVDFNEIGIALLEDGPAVYKYKDQYNAADKIGEVKNCEAAVVRDEANKVTNYEFAITWNELFGSDVEFKSGDTIGYSALYNDDDGSGRRGYMEYASGIGTVKDRSLFTYLNLVD